MSKTVSRRPDPLIDEIRETRRRLIEKHGGLAGWVRHLQELEKDLPPGKIIRKEEPKEERPTADR